MHNRRSRSLGALLWHAAILKKRLLGWLLALLLIGLFQLLDCTCGASPRFATFNIESFPKSPRQEAAAFAAIRETGVRAVGVQEIKDTDAFERGARRHLGPSWAFVHSGRPAQRVGVLFDTDAFHLVSTEVHGATELYVGAKPVLEVKLRPKERGEVTFFVVHLKAGGDGTAMRARQLEALAPIARRAVEVGGSVLVAGDFNATGPDDLVAIRAFAERAGLIFASEDVPCTSYWNRRDGCLGVALDHVLATEQVRVAAEGPCRSEGCDHRETCPVFREEVSDHCPVTIAL